MKQFHSLFIILFCLFIAVPHAAAKQTVFGPVKYDVKKRHGKENRYSATFTAGKGQYVVKLQLGDEWRERPEFMEFMLNGKQVLKEDRYGHRVIGYFSNLQGKNALDLSIKDARPSGFRRPALPPRFVRVTVLPVKGRMPEGAFGGITWKAVMDNLASIRKIKKGAVASLAANAADLRNGVSSRAEAVRKLSDMKETSAQFLWRKKRRSD